MTDISSHFVLMEPELIREDLKNGPVTYIPVGAEDFACSGKVSFNQSSSDDDRGTVWKLSFRAVTQDCTIRRYDGRRIYIGLVMTDGSVRIMGTAAEAPLLCVTPYAGASLVTSTIESAIPVDL